MVPIATELATAYISLVPSFKGGTAKLERELGAVGDGAGKRAGGGFSSAFGKAASLAAPLLAGAAILGQVKDVFAAASESRKIAALTEQVIKTTGGAAKISADQVADLAGSLAKKTGVDDEVIQSGANLLLTFKNIRDEAGQGNDIFSQTTALANDMSVALGQDMASSSMQLGKALNDPIKGIGALSRVGVSFTEQQKEQIKTLTESGDVLGAQKIILGEVEAQFGGAAEAAATPMDKLKVVAGDLQEKLGEKLLPVVDKVATWLGEHLPSMLATAGDAFSRLGDFLEPVVAFFANAFDMGKLLFDMFASGEGDSQGFAEILDNVFGNTGNLIGPLTTLYDIGANVYNFIKDTAIPGIQKAVGSFMDGLQGKGGEGSFFTDLAEGAMGAFRVFKEDVLPVIQKVVGFIKDHLKPILIVLAALFAPGAALIAGFIFAYQKSELFRDVIAGVFQVVKTVITTAIDVIVAVFKFLWPIIVDAAAFFMDVLWPAIKTAFAKIIDVVGWAWENVLKPVFGFLKDFVTNVLIPVFKWLKDVVVDVVFPAIVGIIQTAWAIIEPILGFVSWFVGKVLIPVFGFLKDVIVDFVFPLIMAIIKETWDFIKPIFEGLIWFFNTILMPIFDALWSIVSGAFQIIKDVVFAAWDFIKPILDKVVTFVTETLSPIWSGLVDAVTAAWDMVPGIIGGALKAVGGVIAKFLRGAASIADGLGLDSIAEVLRSGADSADGWGETKSAPVKGKGGLMRAGGGIIPGTGRGDTVPVMATPGEFMIRRSAVAQFGPQFFASLNAGQMPATTGGGPRIEHLEVTTVANANADEVVAGINAKLGWAHTTRRDR